MPLLPLAEQRRIAALLDLADAVRRKREESRRLVDELLRSVFLEMFGDPVRNEKGWEVVRLGEVVARPLRNGVSPSKEGSFTANVLTLTAITGSRFEPEERKEAQFARRPSMDHMVSTGDFLICRGNGNPSLVARGKLVRHAKTNVVFPDTIISATPDTSKLTGEYLEAVWNTGVVRSTIDSGSRTTSGIHKVNQTLLASIRFPLPPVPEQLRFSTIASSIRCLAGRIQNADTQTGALGNVLSAGLFSKGW